MNAIQSFAFEPKLANTKARIDEFIRWAEPGGLGGFDRVHKAIYDRKVPYFDYGTDFLPHSHASSRAWLVRQEFRGRADTTLFSRARAGKEPEIKKPLAMVRPGRFLFFAKAYLNVYCEIRRLRSPAKPTLIALIFLEKALRDLNKGDNDPSNITHLCFKRTATALQKSQLAPTVRFDAGKALEHLSMLVQAGGRFKGDKTQNVFLGFKLIAPSFSFRSPIKAPPKFGKKRPSEDRVVDSGHLTSEEVAAVGLAFRRCIDRYGKEGIPTFFTALMSLPLTTVSMRASELQSLREDALYTSGGRHRLRVPRPKIGIEQDVPVCKALGPLSEEIFEIVRRYSSEAREALAFYIKQSPDALAGVHTLFVPKRLRPLFARSYVSIDEAYEIMDPSATNRKAFPNRLSHALSCVYFVEHPGDIYGSRHPGQVVKVRDLQKAFERLRPIKKLPTGVGPGQYISISTAIGITGSEFCRVNSKAKLAMRKLFASDKARTSGTYISRDDLLAYLLAEFKKTNFPHWPYTSKDRSVRLDHALALHFGASSNSLMARGMNQPCWWLPRLLSIQTLNRWISGNCKGAALSFELTDVKMGDGSYPSISVHRTRRYHHTVALLAGASPLFANELAGRQSGWQGEAYDYRTPLQIVRGSIDTYDADQGTSVIGPTADQAPPIKRIVARRIFFAQNAAPKHVHEMGGCVRDLSLDPCDEFGDCMRCDKHVWRKGDEKRFTRIQDMRDEALRIIPIAKLKLKLNPRLTSVSKYLTQQKEVLARCNEILRVEADASVEVGTLITFPAAPSLMTNTELRSRHRRMFLSDDSTQGPSDNT